MSLLLDLLYGLVLLITLPVWLTRMIRTGKIRTDWAGRLGRRESLPPPTRRRVLIHAVSVGEVNAVRLLVSRLAASSSPMDIVVATTTDTGFARACDLFASDHAVVRYPFDFSFAVRRFLDAVRPDAVVLVELEVWPNFMCACQRRRTPVCVVNGRLSERSFARYRRLRPLVRRMFRRLRFAAVQSETYARRFEAIGLPANSVIVTGTMKWDTAQIADTVPGADALADALGIDRARPLVVAGSTAPGEHELLQRCVPDDAQLLCAPRRPEWFDDAAAALPGAARRSRGDTGSSTGRFLLDTIGELRAAYALADLVVVGRTFGDLHGSDMMEPVALGKATIVGPAVSDFQETVTALRNAQGIVQVVEDELPQTIRGLLADEAERRAIAGRGREVIRQHQGATDRHLSLILDLLANPTGAGSCPPPGLSLETSPP